MSKLKAPLYLITATGLGLQFYNPNLISPFNDSSLVSPSFPERVQTTFNGVLRSSRAVSSIFLVAADYKYSMRGVPEGSEDYRNKLSEVHLRSAKKILKLCETNKGFYVKAGQFVATMKRAPEEYTSILCSLQDKVIPCRFKAIEEVLIRNLGNDFQEKFVSLDERPIAAASIAQVHRAVLKDCQEVAVKVQYPWLERQMKMDIATMSFVSKSFEWFFPGFRFSWLVTEFVEAISQELDFVQEAKNGERTANNFKNNKMVKVPRIFWDLTTNQVLTMEFCRGCKVDDVEYMKERGINPVKVAKALVEVFGEMIFVHGFLHGDPHPGNILVAPEGQNGFSLVLLDHGIYKELDEGFRLNYCKLWEALIAMDSNKIQRAGEKLGAGKYSMFFPFIFMGKTIDSKSAPGGGMSMEEKRNINPEAKAKMMDEISTFIESLAPDFFLILRTDGLLRAVIKTLGASHQVRLLAYAKYAFQGLSQQSNSESGLSIPVMFAKLKTNMMFLRLRLVLGLMDLFSWISKVRNILYFLFGRDKVVGVMERFPWLSKVRNFLFFLFGGAGAFLP